MEFKRIGVIGAGNIGIGVVTDLVVHGITAIVVDVSEPILKHAKEEVLNNIRFAPLLSKSLPRIHKEEAMQLMTFTKDINEVASCDFIIENVTEDWKIKEPVYEQLINSRPMLFGANTLYFDYQDSGRH
jgi:3-hydroxybutyryl-CoA dehydrogenase